MKTLLRSCVLLFLLLASSGLAFADSLTVNLSMNCPPGACFVDPFSGGIPGNYAVGSADFNPVGDPWSYSFQTAIPLSWTYDQQTGNYFAQLGYGGSFLMNGPDGLTFVGTVTTGFASQSCGSGCAEEVSLSFFGQWSNGLYGYGSITDQISDQFGPQATLNAGVAPEPASFALLGTGVFGAWGWKKRILRGRR